jgi:hypothetical protein
MKQNMERAFEKEVCELAKEAYERLQRIQSQAFWSMMTDWTPEDPMPFSLAIANATDFAKDCLCKAVTGKFEELK